MDRLLGRYGGRAPADGYGQGRLKTFFSNLSCVALGRAMLHFFDGFAGNDGSVVEASCCTTHFCIEMHSGK